MAGAMSNTDLLPSNATALERALAASAGRPVPVPLRTLWDAERCPLHLLPWLAWSVGVERWDPAWPEHIKRAQVRAAIRLHRRKGSAGSVRDAVSAFGSGVALREWWQMQPPGVAHTFEITLTPAAGAPTEADYQDDIIAAIDAIKPQRSSYQLVTGLAARGTIGLFMAARAVLYTRLDMAGRAYPPAALPAVFDTGRAWAVKTRPPQRFAWATSSGARLTFNGVAASVRRPATIHRPLMFFNASRAEP